MISSEPAVTRGADFSASAESLISSEVEIIFYDPENIVPIEILQITNLNGDVTSIQDDPDDPDSNWLTYVTVENTLVRVGMDKPSFSPTGSQNVKVLVRPNGPGTNNPTVTIALFSNGTQVATLLNNATLTVQTVYSLNFASSLVNPDGSQVEIQISGTRSGGGTNTRRTVEVGAVRWVATKS